MINFANLGAKIRAYRLAEGLTQQQLAEKAAVNQAYIGYIESGDKKPGLELTVKIADILGVTVDNLIR